MQAADGVVRTFVFTDIEGSTRAWQADEASMRRRLTAHDQIARSVVGARAGTIFKHTGDGCIAVFGDAGAAVVAAVAMHGELAKTGLRVRVGVHEGPAVERDGDWFGLTLNRCARIMAAAHGGQTLTSGAVAASVGSSTDLALHPLGRHHLRDLDEPEDLYQVEVGSVMTAFPPPRTVAPVIGLPAERSTFVGRSDDVARLTERIGTERLVTVAGVGGAGKTRLAIRAAADAQVGFPGGAAFVDLTSVGAPDRLVATVARAVGAPSADAVGTSDHAELAAFIGYRRLLVVLDNAEHLVDDVAAAADLLLDRCPRLHLLVTSREPLGIEGEVVQRVTPLPSDEAVSLFRARLSRQPTEDDEQRIAAICAALDGLPLAIELAAGRVAQLGAARVESLLNDRFALLAGGVRRARHRQRTLEATMDWSYDLLGDDERALLRRLSVIAGPVDADLALGIGAHADASAAQTAATLTSLADKSLLVVGSPLLETVRDYAATKLAAVGETAEARDRHLAWHLEAVGGLVEQASLDQARARLEPRLADLEAARGWAIDRGDLEAAAALAARAWPVHVLRLELAESQRWLDLAAEHDQSLSMDDRLRWRIGTMWTAGARADAWAGLGLAGEVVALAPDGHPLRVSALAFQAQAVAHIDAAEARRLLEVAWQQVDPAHPEQPVQLRTIEALTFLADLDLASAAGAFAAAAASDGLLPGYFARSALVLRPLCLHLADDRDAALDALDGAALLSGVDDTFLQAIVRAYVHATVRPSAAGLRALLDAIDDRDPVAMTQPFAVAAAAELARSDGDGVLAEQLFASMATHRWHLRHEALTAHLRTRLGAAASPPTAEPLSTVDLVDQARRLAQG